MDEAHNQELDALLEALGVPRNFPRPDYRELVKEAREVLGLELSEEEARGLSIELRRAIESAGCEGCSSQVKDCSLSSPGFVVKVWREEGGRLTYSFGECPRAKAERAQERQRELLFSSRIPEAFFDKGLRTFKTTPGTARAAQVAAELAQDEKRRGVVFWGPPGVGKTHLAAAILINRLRRGGEGLYITVPDLMDEIRSSFSREGKTEAIRQELRTAAFLVLDDMGAEKPTELVLEELFKIVNGRLLDGRQTVVTTNFSEGELSERFGGIEGARIVSRLRELCEWVELRGEDFRAAPLAPAAPLG